MCSNPQTIVTENGSQVIACRHCDDCIAARKNDWVARAMAEKATCGHAVALNLTYRNDAAGRLPEAAVVFKYKDVQDFVKRLREQYFEEYGERGAIRYIVAGEQGSQRGRVHWHMICFADRSLEKLGKWAKAEGGDLEGMVYEKRCLWSLWPYGHVFPQQPDQGGMAYVLKYALKDQFNVANAKGTMRFTKAETHGASMFRMSKKPPIGWRFVEAKIVEMRERRVVPTRPEILVPGLNGYWWPRGKLRELWLDGLRAVNEEWREATGRDAPQWETLLSMVSGTEKNLKDWERLVYGEIEEEADAQRTVDQWRKHLEGAQAARATAARGGAIRRQCGGLLVCRGCWATYRDEGKAKIVHWIGAQRREAREHCQDPERYFREKGKINPFCHLRADPERERIFGA